MAEKAINWVREEKTTEKKRREVTVKYSMSWLIRWSGLSMSLSQLIS